MSIENGSWPEFNLFPRLQRVAEWVGKLVQPLEVHEYLSSHYHKEHFEPYWDCPDEIEAPEPVYEQLVLGE